MQSLSPGFKALVFGATGGIGQAVADTLEADPACSEVVRLSRTSLPAFDLLDETAIAAAAEKLRAAHGGFDLIFDATGALEINGAGPEKSIRALDPAVMARQFAVNAIGPALLLKHFSPLLPADRRALFATLSARVGSIGDNRLGGWMSYRAAKAALNQIVRTAAVEIARTRKQAVLVALHPGTVDTSLSRKYSGGHQTFSPMESAGKMLATLDGLQLEQTGGFFAYDGTAIEW